MQDRRGSDKPDTGKRRRSSDLRERQEEFRLFRDKVLLLVGTSGVTGIAIAATFIDIKNSAVLLAALATFSALLGVPTALRIDERRKNRNSNGSGA